MAVIQRELLNIMETYLPPNRELSVKTKAILAKNNSLGNNFGGWLMAQMHLAGQNVAAKKAKGRVEAIAINDLVFHKTILPGDEVSCYAEIIRMNRSYLTLHIEAWARHSITEEETKVTEGTFTYFAVDLSNGPFPSQTTIISPPFKTLYPELA